MALTAPINATASPAWAASARTERPDDPRSATIVGSNTQGASIIGKVSDEIDPSLVSGDTCPGDWANVNASAIAPTNANHRRDSGPADEPDAVSAGSACADPAAGLATVAVLDPVEH